MKAKSLQKNVSILGPGLLGGSLALALQAVAGEKAVTLWGRRQEAVDEALSMGVRSVTTDLVAAVAEADLVILGTPVGVMPDLVRQIIEAVPNRSLLISDVGSVKRAPDEAIQPLLRGTPHHFIGGHPMAGSERKGMMAARADLFQGALTALTPADEASDENVSILRNIWELTGSGVRVMGVVEHDLAVARFSHYPHLVSSLCADISLSDPKNSDVSGNGLLDTTRVASGDAAMWAEILMENRIAVADLVEQSIDQLRDVLDTLRGSDHHQLQTFLQRAKERRDALNHKSSAQISSHE